VADIATYPWIQPYMHGTDLSEFPHVHRWYETVKARPAVQRAYELLAEDCKIGDKSDSTHENLFAKQRTVGKTSAGEEEGRGRARGDVQKSSLPKLELWYTPIKNHVHAVEAVVNICELHHHVLLIPTSPFQVQDEPHRPGFATLPQTNPLLTVPAMKVDDKDVLYGGPVIYEYLNTLRPPHVPSLLPADETAALQTRRSLWLADGLFDQFVRLILEDLEDTKRKDMVERTWRKIEGSLDALDQDAARWLQGSGAPVDLAQVRAACTLDFISHRPGPALLAGEGQAWSWREGRQELARWFDRTHCLAPFQRHLADALVNRAEI
jgi:glutathione S-transferase